MAIEEPPNDHDPWGDPHHQSELDVWLMRFKHFLKQRMRRSPSGGLRRRRRWHESLPWAIALIVAVWLATGVGMLAPGQIALLYVLGQPVGQATSGNFWNWPAPLGDTRILDLVTPHSRYIRFRTLTEKNRPVSVTARYVYRIAHPGAYELFAAHPALWLRGQVLAQVGAWVRHEPHPIRSARDPGQPIVRPETGTIVARLNRSLDAAHTGLHLVQLSVRVHPPHAVDQVLRAWLVLHENEKHLVAAAEKRFRKAYAAQKQSEQHKQMKIEMRTRRWVERARLATARFRSLLMAYRRHPTLVRQWLVGSFLRRLAPLPKILGLHRADVLLGPKNQSTYARPALSAKNLRSTHKPASAAGGHGP